MHAKLPAKCCDVRAIHRLMKKIWHVYKTVQPKELVKFEHLQYSNYRCEPKCILQISLSQSQIKYSLPISLQLSQIHSPNGSLSTPTHSLMQKPYNKVMTVIFPNPYHCYHLLHASHNIMFNFAVQYEQLPHLHSSF